MSRKPTPVAGSPDNVVSIAAALDAPIDAPTLAQAGDAAPFGGRDEDDEFDRPTMPAECPVKALGVGTDGQTCWYLNRLGQLVELKPRDHGKNNLHVLFAPSTHLLAKYWPRWSEPRYEGRGTARTLVKESEIIGFDQNEASEALIAACGTAGIFDAQGRVRGRGAHKGKGGTLIYHSGDRVMVARKRLTGQRGPTEWFDTGLIDGYVYPAAASIPKPAPDPSGADKIDTLLALIHTWNWRRGAIDAQLALGWLAQTAISGAIGWRSHLFVTGGRGTGKSTFNGKDGLCDRVLGSGALRTGSATEAAVRQMLRAQTIPVIFDEFEPNGFNAHKLASVLELARVASSGGDVHKGSSDHKAAEFVLNSCFQFSAILTPDMPPQDRSRFAVLELKPFATREDGAPAVPKLDLDAAGLPEVGAILMRRMFDGWHRWGDTFTAYHDALTGVGHSPRSADTFGTLLAAADLALYDAMPPLDLLEEWAQACAPDQLAEIAEADEDHTECLGWLTSTTAQARGSDLRETLGTWIARAVSDNDDVAAPARAKLGELGLAVMNARPLGGGRWGASGHMTGQPCYLAIAGKHRALAEIYGPTKWQGAGYPQALSRAPGAKRGVKVKFTKGVSLTATLVPIELLIEPSDVPGFVACSVEGAA